ncbi:MAG: hypothetical protein ACYCWE_15815 [Eubacteriales bacterium]
MKKNWLFKLFSIVVILTLISTFLISGTLAKYATSVTAANSVTVAKWVAIFQNNGTGNSVYTSTFDLIGTLNDTGVNGNLLAPGTSGSFNLVYDTNGTQVARNILVTMDASALLNSLTYLKFYSDSNFTTEIAPVSGVLTLLNMNAGPLDAGNGTINVYWQWPFANANDEADTADGIAAATYSVTVTFIATQIDAVS